MVAGRLFYLIVTTLAVSDGTTTTNLPAFTAGTPESFSYDDDGNLLTDGRWSRTYDAENRLIAQETTAGAYGAGTPRQKLAYRYDPFGRRVGKQVYQYAGGWVLASERRFAYDEWNLIGEFSVSGSTLTGLRTYAWGLDLSGSRQGAGGVGGLLKVTEAGNSYLPIYDGNGNVLGMIKASDGSLAAAYEYDAFGRTLRESGPYTGNPVRYSSKYTDPETGEIYYGYRVYSPSLGRFLNRDPKAESGGLNLYAFLGNNGVGQVDYLGLLEYERPWRYNNMGLGWDDDPIDLPPVTVTTIGSNDIGASYDHIIGLIFGGGLGGDRIQSEGGWGTTIVLPKIVVRPEPEPDPVPFIPPIPVPGVATGPQDPNNPDLSKLPGCSELRKQIDAGKSPALTAQSFIENKTGGGIFRGDNRGFTPSPADGVSATYRTTASVSWLNAPSGEAGITRMIGGLYTGQATPSVSGYVGIEQYMTGPGSYGYNHYIQYGQLSASASDPFFSVMGHDFAPPAVHSISATMNYETGFASGTVTHTDFPGLQVFVGDQPVFNYSANANGKGSLDIYDMSMGQFSVQIFDPSR